MTLPSSATNHPNFAEIYEQALVPHLFRPWAEVLLDQVQLSAGDRVLDIACGTGIGARLAKERLGSGGQVVGVDQSQPMLAVARAVAPSIDWREGNAGALPVDDRTKFDVVLCHQGLQFFPDRPAAVREMRRVLASGGRMAIATWRPVEESPMVRELGGVAERHLGPIVDQRHAFGDGNAIAVLLTDAGLNDISVRTMTRLLRLPDATLFVRLNAMALVGMSSAGKTMDEEKKAQVVSAIVADSGDVIARYADGEGLAFHLGSNVATARG